MNFPECGFSRLRRCSRYPNKSAKIIRNMRYYFRNMQHSFWHGISLHVRHKDHCDSSDKENLTWRVEKSKMTPSEWHNLKVTAWKFISPSNFYLQNSSAISTSYNEYHYCYFGVLLNRPNFWVNPSHTVKFSRLYSKSDVHPSSNQWCQSMEWCKI